MFEQGVRAANYLTSHIENPELTAQAFVKIPALLPSINMRTAAGPMHELVTKAQAFEQEESVIAVSVFGGFPYADIPGAGASVVVLAHNSDRAAIIAEELAQDLWDRKEMFIEHLPGVSESIDRALDPAMKTPVVLADIADNPLSGGSADTTALLEEIVLRDLQDVFFGALCDRELLVKAHQTGIGSTFECEFGGKQSPEFGKPVALRCEVIALGQGKFINDGPMNSGLDVDVEGAALLRHRGIDLFITGRPITANDPNLFRHLGVDINRYRILVLKVKNHFRAAFEPLVGEIISVDAPGVATNDFRNLAYAQLPKDIWPLNNFGSFSPSIYLSMVGKD
jgi:microcystin degradation protein MlrC